MISNSRAGLTPVAPVFLVNLFPGLHAELMALLRGLARQSRHFQLFRPGRLPEPAQRAFFQSLDPHSPALFPVAWAGEDVSPNWFDIGREYTERWLLRALPFAYREVVAPAGSSVRFEIGGEAGGVWTLIRVPHGWRLFAGSEAGPDANVSLDQETAWKLFSKGLDQDSAAQRVQIQGESRLGQPVLNSVAVMA